MNEILILGHAASGLHEVESQLFRCGMQPANPSKREGLHASAITAMICKAHNGPNASDVELEDDFLQLPVGGVWHGLALDLMLGNLQQPLWGWADCQSIFLLDYWKSVEPRMTFVLVYDEPHRSLIDSDSFPSVSKESVEKSLKNWIAYNSAMLRFFLRNRNRCLLVHARQINLSTEEYLDQLRDKVGVSLREKVPALEQAIATAPEIQEFGNEISPPSVQVAHALRGLSVPEDHIQSIAAIGAVGSYLANHLMESFPACGKLYQELQAAADLPHEVSRGGGADALEAWRGFAAEKAAYLEILRMVCTQLDTANAGLRQRDRELLSLNSERDSVAQRQLQLELALQQSKILASEGKAALSEAHRQVKQLKSEIDKIPSTSDAAEALSQRKNALLVQQLNQLHIEMAHQRAQAKKQGTIDAAQRRLKPGAVEQTKQDLPYRLGKIVVNRGVSLTLPWIVARESKLFWAEQGDRENFRPLSDFSDAHEVKNVKKHLSYRLGAILVEQGTGPFAWFKLPFCLLREYRNFKRERINKNEGLK